MHHGTTQPLEPRHGTILGIGYFATAPSWRDTGSSVSGIGYGAKIVTRRAGEEPAVYAVVAWDLEGAWLAGADHQWTYDDASHYMEQACVQLRREQVWREMDAIENARREQVQP